MGAGLVKAQAHLTELDLSDNAFGPIGVEGLAALLRSPSCYALEELRLNNNGLGITGGKLLASALTDCYNHSSKEGKPLPLRVFIAGRNRLENEGAGALAEVFKVIFWLLVDSFIDIYCDLTFLHMKIQMLFKYTFFFIEN